MWRWEWRTQIVFVMRGLSSDIKTSPDMSSVFVAEERGKSVRSKGRGALGGGRGRGRGDSADTKTEKGFTEYRTCNICLKKGHIARDCPDRIERVTVNVVQAAEEENEESEYESSFLAARLADSI
jgi:hypothetical protein